MRVVYLIVVAALVVLLGALEMIAERRAATAYPPAETSRATAYWK